MGFYTRLPVAFATAILAAAAGFATPYSQAITEDASSLAVGPSRVAIAAAQSQTTTQNSVAGRRLDAAARSLDRITRQLRSSIQTPPTASDSLAIARDVQSQLASLGSLELILGQSAIEDRASMARMRVPAELQQRYEENEGQLRQRLGSFRAVANRVERALGSNNVMAASAALSELRVQLAKSDVTRRQPFNPKALVAQRVQRESRRPVTTRAGLTAFLASDATGARTLTSDQAGATVAPELTGSAETTITPEIESLAAELAHNPVRIFNWVHNNIDFVPTHGSIQGAALTLANRRGNAADTNSLLAALLRASGIPTRFVYGTVDVPIAQAINWLKAKDVESATGLAQLGGIPTTVVKLDGQIVSLRIQHLWVEAFIDFTPSRGAINRAPDAWIPMDASFKQYNLSPPVDVLGLGNWNPSTAANALLDGASIGADGSVTGLNTTRFHDYSQEVVKRIVDQATDDSLRDPQVALGRYSIGQSQLPVITGTLPFAVSIATTRFSAIPSSLKYFVDIQQFATAQDIALENPSLAVRMSTAELAGQSIYVDYAPATAADALALQSYEVSNAASLPLSALSVVPRLMLGDRVLASGSSVQMGTQQYWVAGVVDLQGHIDGTWEPYQFAAGSRISFTPDLGGMGEDLLGANFKGLADSSEQPIARALHLAGVQYWYLNDSRAALYARGWGGQFLRLPSIGVFAAPLQVRYFFGIPRTGYFSGFATDIKSDRIGVFHSDPAKAVKLTYQIGANGSLSESLTWDLLLNNRPGDSLSASSILAWANRARVPIHTITAGNIDSVLPKIQTTSDVKDEIRNAVNAGFQVVIPEKEFSGGGVQAAGYVIADTETGAAVYRVDGGLNGAINVGCIAKAVLLKVICESKFARLMATRLAVLAERFAVSIGLEAVLAAVAPPLAVILPIVSAVVLAVTIIETTYEVLTWVREVMNGDITLTPEEMAEAGIRAINDYACNYLSPCFNNPVGYLAGQAIDTGLNLVDVGAANAGGPTVGNPVSVGTGIKTQVEPDYQGEGPFPLSYTRTYVSYLPNGSPVGHRWVSNYHHRLVLPDGATAMNAPDAVLIQRGDGSWLQFAYRSGSYAVNGDVPDRLERVNDGLGRTTGWLLHAKDDTTEGYDPDGRLLWIDNRTGLRQSLTYAADGQLDAVVDPFGRSLHFEHDPVTRQVTALIDPDNRRTTYAYDNGALVKVTYPDQSQRQYHYETPGWPTLLTGISDERGVRYATWKYDADNRVVESAHAGGADLTRLSYGDNTTTVTDPRGAIRTYRFTRIYDTLRLTQVSEPCSTCSAGGTASITYDGNGYPSMLTDFNGNKSQVHIDTRGLPEQWTRGLGTTEAQTVSVQWHPAWRVPVTITETSATGTAKITRYTYDDRGNPRQRAITVDGQTRVWNYEFNAAGQMEQVDGPRSDVNDVVRYAYDDAGNLSQMVDAAGLTTRYPVYDAHGRVVQMIDPNGLVTDYRYDARDRLLESRLSGPGLATPEITAFEYKPMGSLAKLTLPDGSWLQYDYDDAQRLVGIRDSRGNRIHYGLDAAGDRTQEQTFAAGDTLAQTVNRVIDNLGRMAQAYGADPAEAVNFSYDSNGNERTALAPLHDLPTESRYDALDRLRQTIDPGQGSVAYDYDAQDNLRKIIDPRGLSTNYDYDGFDELATLTSPDTGVTRFAYDAAGNLASRTDARDIVGTYRYDANNRLAAITYPDEAIAYSYDEPSGGAGAKGRLTTLTDGSGHTGYVYDAVGRVLEKAQQLGADTNPAARRNLRNTYVGGRVDETELPSGARLRYRYGADGRVLEITVNGQTLVREVEYFPFGEPKAWTSAAGRYARTFDADGRIAGYTRGASTATLQFDAAGRIASAEEAGADRPSWRYGYDPLDRLARADNASGSGPLANLSLRWNYDATGNRTLQQRVVGATAQDTSYTIDPASNRLVGVGGQARAYDPAGNTTSTNGQTFVYSGRGRLAEVRVGATVQARYRYNALGERVCAAYNGNSCPDAMSTGSGYTQFVYDDDGHLVGEYDAAGNLLAEHVWLGDTPIAVLKQATSASTFGGQVAGNVAVYFVQPDQLDTPRVIVNASNATVWRWDSAPFGDTTADESPGSTAAFTYRLRFPGQQFDAVTGTNYNYFRDYDSTLARYIQSDPTGLTGGLNTYAYVADSPLDAGDADGLRRGNFSKKLLRDQYRRDPFCTYCGKKTIRCKSPHPLRFNGDHFISLKNGGTNDVANLVTSCQQCNLEKGSKNGPAYKLLKITTLAEAIYAAF